MESEQQIKETIALLKDRHRLISSFVLPIITAEVVAIVSQHFLTNTLYICLSILGLVFLIGIIIFIVKIDKTIRKLIKRLE